MGPRMAGGVLDVTCPRVHISSVDHRQQWFGGPVDCLVPPLTFIYIMYVKMVKYMFFYDKIFHLFFYISITSFKLYICLSVTLVPINGPCIHYIMIIYCNFYYAPCGHSGQAKFFKNYSFKTLYHKYRSKHSCRNIGIVSRNTQTFAYSQLIILIIIHCQLNQNFNY